MDDIDGKVGYELVELVGDVSALRADSVPWIEKDREIDGREVDTGGGGDGDGLDFSNLEMSSLAVGLTSTSWIMSAIIQRMGTIVKCKELKVMPE